MGEDIGCDTAEWYGKSVDINGDAGTPGIRSTRLVGKLGETAYSTLPFVKDGRVYYKYLIENPYPAKQIADVKFILPEGADWTVSVL